MKLNLKYTASKVDEIEQASKMPLSDCIGQPTISNLALFIQKGLIDDNGTYGVSKNVALSTIDKYLEESDLDSLVLDITEALVNAGFLSRELNVEQLRELKEKRLTQVQKKINENI